MVKPALSDTNLPGLQLINTQNIEDNRGSFMKLASPSFPYCNVPFVEQFLTVSVKDVIRGMHFQVPPYHHYKLVTCLSGSALDLTLDLRVDSPTFGKTFSIYISPSSPSIYIPPGIAHGFLSLAENTKILYNVTSEYNAEHDLGIHYNSFNFNWPTSSPIVSKRDLLHPGFSEYKSPFVESVL